MTVYKAMAEHRRSLIVAVRKAFEENLQGYIECEDSPDGGWDYTEKEFTAYVLTCASEIAEEVYELEREEAVTQSHKKPSADEAGNPVWPEDMEDCGGIDFAVSCIAYRESTRRYLYKSHTRTDVDNFVAYLEGYVPGIEGFRFWNPEEADKVYAEWVNGTLGI